MTKKEAFESVNADPSPIRNSDSDDELNDLTFGDEAPLEGIKFKKSLFLILFSEFDYAGSTKEFVKLNETHTRYHAPQSVSFAVYCKRF